MRPIEVRSATPKNQAEIAITSMAVIAVTVIVTPVRIAR